MSLQTKNYQWVCQYVGKYKHYMFLWSGNYVDYPSQGFSGNSWEELFEDYNGVISSHEIVYVLPVEILI